MPDNVLFEGGAGERVRRKLMQECDLHTILDGTRRSNRARATSPQIIVCVQHVIAVRIGLALTHVLDASPDHELAIHWDTFLASLSEPVRKELEMELQRRKWEPRSDWGRKIYAEGMAEGEAKGMAKGRAEGDLFGQIKGRAAAIIDLLELRGLSVSADLRGRVMACTDLALLDQWFRQAAKAQSIEEAFAP